MYQRLDYGDNDTVLGISLDGTVLELTVEELEEYERDLWRRVDDVFYKKSFLKMKLEEKHGQE
jgi:hypothetical protein